VAFRDIQPQLLISNCGRSTKGKEFVRWIDNESKTATRPVVFDEYSDYKGL
jgi:hypothetical protein